MNDFYTNKTKKIVYFHKTQIESLCTMLKYLSLVPPLERIDELKNTIDCKTAGKILYMILLNSEWAAKKDEKYCPDFKSSFKCKFKKNWTSLFKNLITSYGKLSENDFIYSNHTLQNYKSNYESGYYGEVYDRANLNY